ncbi:MAG: carotenoid biosynthesis protein [Anaerolineales bacterium]|nr:carotenoid biosynthesis protein [Anaerolineales bacterium]
MKKVIVAGVGIGGLAAALRWQKLGFWLLIWVLTPIGLWTIDEAMFPFLAALGVLAQLGAVMAILRVQWPWEQILRRIVLLTLAAWLVEFWGSKTGFPFGSYQYTDVLQPQLGGVPLLIPLAWAMMLLPAWAVADVLLSSLHPRLNKFYPLVFALVSGLAFTAWDLYLDPQMVSRGMWFWKEPGGYFGIPWANYLGWWFSASLLTLLARPPVPPREPLLLIYTLTWLFQAIGLGFFWGQTGPAIAGLAGMGVFALAAWLRLWRIHSRRQNAAR